MQGEQLKSDAAARIFGVPMLPVSSSNNLTFSPASAAPLALPPEGAPPVRPAEGPPAAGGGT
jgi:hypothetical protein